MKRILTLAITATTLIGLGACGSDNKLPSGNGNISPNLTLPSDLTLPSGVSLPSDLTLPSDLSIPADLNLSAECRQLAMSFAGVMAQAFAPTAQASDLEKVFGDLSSKVPDDLKDDVAVMATAFAKYGQIMKDNGNDMTNPAVQKALGDLGTPEVQAASDNITAYFDTVCPQS